MRAFAVAALMTLNSLVMGIDLGQDEYTATDSDYITQMKGVST